MFNSGRGVPVRESPEWFPGNKCDGPPVLFDGAAHNPGVSTRIASTAFNRQVTSGPMSRRLISLLVVWFGLFSVIAPAVTCAAAASHGDCCPPEAPPPCGECPEKRGPALPDQTHCVISPAQVSVAAVVSPTAEVRSISPDVPDVVAAFDSSSFANSPPVRTSSHPKPAARFASSAAFIYLVTGRLRL